MVGKDLASAVVSMIDSMRIVRLDGAASRELEKVRSRHMNTNVTNGPWRRFKIQLRKTWSELTDEDLEAICRNSDDLVPTVQHRYDCGQNGVTKPPIRALLNQISSLTRVCRRLPVSAFV